MQHGTIVLPISVLEDGVSSLFHSHSRILMCFMPVSDSEKGKNSLEHMQDSIFVKLVEIYMARPSCFYDRAVLHS